MEWPITLAKQAPRLLRKGAGARPERQHESTMERRNKWSYTLWCPGVQPKILYESPKIMGKTPKSLRRIPHNPLKYMLTAQEPRAYMHRPGRVQLFLGLRGSTSEAISERTQFAGFSVW